ncbi:MAG: polysaccharide deacetylase family protein [Bryobacterales bacterium]|nr:polysaccharide deacetylase family protein [Bryobacterales bacterium]
MILEAGYAGVAAAAGFMAYAVRGRGACLLAPSVWRGPRTKKRIALTFDDGPAESTGELLDLLDTAGARCTFFQIGRHVERLGEITAEAVRRGHEIGNHTYSHSPLYLRPRQFIEDEIALCQDAIERASGSRPLLFRAPYGCRWFGLREAQRRHGLMGVMWTAIGQDWREDASSVHRRMKSAARPGAILCLHDGRELTPKPDIRDTIEAVRRLLPELRGEGYDLVTVSDLLCPASAAS